jgi:hypothetical protein
VIFFFLLCVISSAALLKCRLPGESCADAPGKTAFKPKEFFDGRLQAWGLFQDFSGAPVARFSMQADASWEGNKGMMHEVLTFANGLRKERQWTFIAVDDRHFSGTAPDVIGEARGEACGAELHWVYTILLPVNGQAQAVGFDDRLYLLDENHVFSKIKIRKWGLPVGRLTMFFEKTKK